MGRPSVKRTVIATILEAAGILAVSAGAARVAVWAGLLVLGVGLVLFGISVERPG